MVINEEITESEIASKIPCFFRKNAQGSRETREVYRGFIIVKHTQKFTRGGSQRWTIIYAVDTGRRSWNTYTTLHTELGFSQQECREIIDKMLKIGVFCNNLGQWHPEEEKKLNAKSNK